MRWLFGGLFAASITMLGLSPALAVSCGPGTSGSINIDLGASAATCFDWGNGNLPSTPGGAGFIDASNTALPDILHLSYTLLHIDGDVSFTAPSGYSSFLLGFQLASPRIDILKPDWFVFKLNGDTSEHFDSDWVFHIGNNTFELPSDEVKFAVLYGVPGEVTVSTTPLPAALPLFAGGLGVFGLLARRRKKKAAVAAA